MYTLQRDAGCLLCRLVLRGLHLKKECPLLVEYVADGPEPAESHPAGTAGAPDLDLCERGHRIVLGVKRHQLTIANRDFAPRIEQE
eukprot:1644957-Prymnesium_polylepis.3